MFSARKLVRGITITVARAEEGMTQAVSSSEAPKFPLIVLIDTFTMVVSISSIIVDVMIVITIIHFLNPVSMPQN